MKNTVEAVFDIETISEACHFAVLTSLEPPRLYRFRDDKLTQPYCKFGMKLESKYGAERSTEMSAMRHRDSSAPVVLRRMRTATASMPRL